MLFPQKVLGVLFIAVILICPFPIQSQIQLQGRVIDEAGQPLAAVKVELIGQEKLATTDAQGRYSFSGLGIHDPASEIFSFQGGVLRFHVESVQQQAIFEFFDYRGSKVGESHHRNFSKGDQSLDLASLVPMGERALILHAKLGTSSRYLKLVRVAGRLEGSVFQKTELAPTLKSGVQAVDSLHFSLRGYENEVLSLNSLSTGLLPDVVLKKGIAFEPFFVGSGKILNLSTQREIFIPKEERIHVLLFPDGYIQSDLNAGRYDRDVQDWFDDVFPLVPFDFYKEAFIIWKAPIPSPSQVGGTTYFQISIDQYPGNMSVTAQKTWALLDRFPFRPKHFASSRVRNFVAQFMILNPSSGRSGFSGRATSLTNPSNSRERVGIAIAQSQHHEFNHAFSQVSDEYYDRGHGSAGTSATSNLSGTTKCDLLPWRHLVYGGQYNTSVDNLVGAFGSKEAGKNRFHSEFKCLMNGSHHNADLYGGSNNLRVNRLCNWCRELAAYRVYFNALILRDAGTAWNTWVSNHRKAHYNHFKFYTPNPTPQRNSEGKSWFLPCDP